MAVSASRISIELRPDAEVLSGRLEIEGDSDREFIGWLGLLSALDAVLGGSPTRAGGSAASDLNEEAG
jgi:hypothetical protein